MRGGGRRNWCGEAMFREIVVKEDVRAVDQQVGMQEALAVLRRHPRQLLRAERFDIEGDGLRGALDVEVGITALAGTWRSVMAGAFQTG